jgi:hypothetical protein
MSGSTEIAHPHSLKLASDSGVPCSRGDAWILESKERAPSICNGSGVNEEAQGQVIEINSIADSRKLNISFTSLSYRRILGLRSHEFGLESQMETRGVESVAQYLECVGHCFRCQRRAAPYV